MDEIKVIEEVECVEVDEKAQEQSLPTIVEPKMEQNAVTMWNNIDMFQNAQRVAKLLASSNIVPQAYRNNLADCVVAIDVANRMGLSPIVVMQNSQIVHGNFSWKGTACKSMIDSCGRYVKTRYVEVGERGKDSWGYYLEAIDKDGDVIKGIPVTMKMAKDEDWYGKNGSKWQTMPELMMKYRASAFFMRTECASLAMGFLTSEENEDIANINKQQSKSTVANLLNEENE